MALNNAWIIATIATMVAVTVGFVVFLWIWSGKNPEPLVGDHHDDENLQDIFNRSKE